jgi:hypothetical protein
MYIGVSVSGYIACVVMYSLCVNVCIFEYIYIYIYVCNSTAVSIHIFM